MRHLYKHTEVALALQQRRAVDSHGINFKLSARELPQSAFVRRRRVLQRRSHPQFLCFV